jgi:myosin-7
MASKYNDNIMNAYRSQSTAPDDLIALAEVNEANILECTKTRFLDSKIYTSMGSVMMSVNPFKSLPLYGYEVIKRYINPFLHGLPPHVYLISSRAFITMRDTGRNQSILFSGESGAGKTEATKACLEYLTFIAGNLDSSTVSNSSSYRASKIISASPILEAFGNAKTIRNPNSSRFGKWMELNFKDNVLCGSTIISYLLEKSRVTQRDSNERNYHIFYQVLRGSSTSQLSCYNLTKLTSDYNYLRRNNSEEAPNLNDEKEFLAVNNAFKNMGFCNEDIDIVLKVVAAVLHLGNIEFISMENGEASSISSTCTSSNYFAALMCIDLNPLKDLLCHRTVVTGGARKSITKANLKPQAARDVRDSLARSLYGNIFLSIIEKINENNKVVDGNEMHSENSMKKIGLLDIFGFEIFIENSFEQL